LKFLNKRKETELTILKKPTEVDPEFSRPQHRSVKSTQKQILLHMQSLTFSKTPAFEQSPDKPEDPFKANIQLNLDSKDPAKKLSKIEKTFFREQKRLRDLPPE